MHAGAQHSTRDGGFVEQSSFDPSGSIQPTHAGGTAPTVRVTPVHHHARPSSTGSSRKGLIALIVAASLLIAVPIVYLGIGLVSDAKDDRAAATKHQQTKGGPGSAWAQWTHGPAGQKYAAFSQELEGAVAPLLAAADSVDVINGFFQVREAAQRGKHLPMSPNREFNARWEKAMNALIEGSDCLDFDAACRATFRTASSNLQQAAKLFNRTDSTWVLEAKLEQ